MGQRLELLCIHCIIDVDSHHFWTSGRCFPHHIHGPADLPRSLSCTFYSCFLISSVLQRTVNNISFVSSAAQPKAWSKHTHEISRLHVKWAQHYDFTHSCVLQTQARRNWESTKVRQQPIAFSTANLQVEDTKDIPLQLQQVLPQLCRCSLCSESKGSGFYSSQHDHHLLFLRPLSSLQSYQLTIHCSTVNSSNVLLQLIWPKPKLSIDLNCKSQNTLKFYWRHFFLGFQ